MSLRVAAHGLAADIPPGWDARIFRRPPGSGETTHPVLHASTFALPAQRGDFGSGAVELMGPTDIFVAIVEYHPDAASTPMFAPRVFPRSLVAESFHHMALQRTIPGQGGIQVFCTHRGRAFCVYVVLGSNVRRHQLVPLVNRLLAGVDIGAPA